MAERGAGEQDVTEAIAQGERFAAKFGRVGFRRNFRFDGQWRGRLTARGNPEKRKAASKDAAFFVGAINRRPT